MEHMHTHEHASVAAPSRGIGAFVPLIVIFVLIGVVAAGIVWWHGFESTFAMRIFMGVFFGVFGAFKAINIRGFADAYSMYDLVAKRSRAYALAYPFIELGLAAAFLWGVALLWVSAATLVLMVVSAVGVANELRKKNEVPCACLGAVFRIPMTKVTLGEDVLMAVMAAAMIAALR